MHYRRTIVPGASYFFTVNLQDRTSNILIEEIVNLRFAFRKTMAHYPFVIEAVVILPDHIHIIMKLPNMTAIFQFAGI
jgi:putative transposase